MKLKRLSSADFDRIAARTRMGERALHMARAVLVEGKTQAEVAVDVGLTKQRVNAAVATIERAFIQAGNPGNGEILISLELPKTIALELTRLIDGLAANDDEIARSKALAQVLRAIRAAANGLRA